MEKLVEPPAKSLFASPESRTMEIKTSMVLAQSSEDEVLMFLKRKYGPGDVSKSLELLRGVKMQGVNMQAPYASEGPFVTFMYEFSETLEWVDLQRPSEKSLIEVFLADIQPYALRNKLKEQDFKTLEALADQFLIFFDKNMADYVFLESQGAFQKLVVANNKNNHRNNNNNTNTSSYNKESSKPCGLVPSE